MIYIMGNANRIVSWKKDYTTKTLKFRSLHRDWSHFKFCRAVIILNIDVYNVVKHTYKRRKHESNNK